MINFFFKSPINQKIRELSSFIVVIFLLGLTVIIISLYGNFKKEQIKNLENIIQNTYFQKTLISISKSLEPRFEKYNYKINAGETFDGILEEINLDIKEISKDVAVISPTTCSAVDGESVPIPTFELLTTRSLSAPDLR